MNTRLEVPGCEKRKINVWLCVKSTRVSILDHEFTTELCLKVFVIQEFIIKLHSIKGKMVRQSKQF